MDGTTRHTIALVVLTCNCCCAGDAKGYQEYVQLTKETKGIPESSVTLFHDIFCERLSENRSRCLACIADSVVYSSRRAVVSDVTTYKELVQGVLCARRLRSHVRGVSSQRPTCASKDARWLK
jgi:hypothetical protein